MTKRRGNGEGNITLRNDGRWVARYTVETPTGPKPRKTISIYGKTRKEVADKLAAALADRNKGLTFDAEGLTVAEYLDRWLASTRDSVKPVSWERYRSNVRLHISPIIGNVKLAKLAPHHVQSLYDEKRRTMSPASVRLIHGVLSAALKQAVAWRLIPENVAMATKRPKPQPVEIAPLSAEQAKALLRAVEGDRYESLYVLALTTGARIGELLALRWSDLDVDSSPAVLRIERTRSAAKEGPQFTSPKGNRGRIAHLTPRAAEALRSHRARQHAERLAVGAAWEEGDLIFPTRTGAPLRPSNLSDDHFKPLLERAGLPRSIRFHDLRHTCATLLLARGVHPKLVQELLGHSSIALTLDRYSHWIPSMGEQTAAAMDAALT
jgi:integrase